MFVNLPQCLFLHLLCKALGKCLNLFLLLLKIQSRYRLKSIASLQQIIFGLGVAAAGAAGSVAYISLSTAKYAEDIKRILKLLV